MFSNNKIERQIAAIQKQIELGKVKNLHPAKQKIKNLQVKAMAEHRQKIWEHHLAR